jgi:hypothetical protein
VPVPWIPNSFIIENTEKISSFEIMTGVLAGIPDICTPNTGVGPLLVCLPFFFWDVSRPGRGGGRDEFKAEEKECADEEDNLG